MNLDIFKLHFFYGLLPKPFIGWPEVDDPVNMPAETPYHCKEGDTGIQGEDQYSGSEGLRS